MAKIKEKCISDIKPSGVYDNMGKMGIQYGPLFTGIASLVGGAHYCTGTMAVPDTAATMSYRSETSHVIHPATLDTCFRFIWPTVRGTQLNINALYLPSSIKRIAISSQMPTAPGSILRVYG